MPDGSAGDVAIRPDDDHPERVANYDRRRPEETLLYQVLQKHWRPFLADLEAGSDGASTPLPRFIVEEIEAYLRCGILAHGFLRVRCEEAFDPALTGRVLGHFVRAVSSWLRRRARRLGIKGTLKTGAVTVIQRFDSAFGLNVHYHSMIFDGVYSRHRTAAQGANGWELVFHPTPAPRVE